MTTVQANKRIDFKHVLFLTDFSEASCEALPFATAIARGYGSKVHAVHVLLPTTYAYMSPEAAVSLLDDLEESAKTEMTRVEAQLTGLQSEAILERGSNLWEVVSQLVKEREIDLIVLGTHGRTGFKKALLGSSAEEVFRRSRVPVLMSGPDTRVGAHNGGRFRCVLFATDFNAVSSVAVPFAVSLAQENQAELILLHALPLPRPGKTNDPRELSVAEAIHRLEDLVPQEARQWCDARAVVEHGDPATRILAAAKVYGADLIVLGVRGMDRFAGAVGRVQKDIAYNVVAHAPCPVLTVRSEG
ncbi:MAG: universal stress protein [Candidatus Acidiferrum sp.]